MRPPPVSVTKNRMSGGSAGGKRNRGTHFIASVCVRSYAWTPVELFLEVRTGAVGTFPLIHQNAKNSLSPSLFIFALILRKQNYIAISATTGAQIK